MTAVWRDYDRARLDAQFSLQIEEIDALFARRAAAAEAALMQHAPRRGVPYADRAGATLDIYAPKDGAAPAPVLIFIHGGFWRSLNASLFAFVADGFVPFGAVVVIIDYPKIPAVRLGAIVGACRDAVAWTYHHIAAFGGDPARLHVAGNSAGGHLVAELMDPAAFAAAAIPAKIVRSGCAISGLFELEPVRLSAQNETLHLDADDVARHSPQRRPPADAPPLLVAVGATETAEFIDQSQAYADVYARAGSSAELMIVPGANHITVVLDHFAQPDDPLNRCMRAMMGISA